MRQDVAEIEAGLGKLAGEITSNSNRNEESVRDAMYQLKAVKKDIADLNLDVRRSVAKSKALIDSNVQKMDYVVEKVNSQTENFNQKLRDYSSKEETSALKDRLEREFATKFDIRNLKMAYTPLIETCQRTLREN